MPIDRGRKEIILHLCDMVTDTWGLCSVHWLVGLEKG